jgi:hypothetical protein
MIPTTIPENHRATLRSVASKKRIGETELVRLYQACDELRTTGTTSAKNVMPSKLEHPLTGENTGPGSRIVLVTVTNHEGVYVQQAQELHKAAGPVLLTIGQKYAMEGMDVVNRQIATRHF